MSTQGCGGRRELACLAAESLKDTLGGMAIPKRRNASLPPRLAKDLIKVIPKPGQRRHPIAAHTVSTVLRKWTEAGPRREFEPSRTWALW